MQTRLKLLTGQKGTKKLTQLYVDKLICVCYRHDEERKRRYKTVELIVDQVPRISSRKCITTRRQMKKDVIVSLRVDNRCFRVLGETHIIMLGTIRK